MRFLGIDYGTKRIGVALSDEAGDFAYPKMVVRNGEGAARTRAALEIAALCASEAARAIVMGESRDFLGHENAIMPDARAFAQELESRTQLQLFWEPEFFTSAEAERLQGKGALHDASAAALILKSFLEKRVRG